MPGFSRGEWPGTGGKIKAESAGQAADETGRCGRELTHSLADISCNLFL